WTGGKKGEKEYEKEIGRRMGTEREEWSWDEIKEVIWEAAKKAEMGNKGGGNRESSGKDGKWKSHGGRWHTHRVHQKNICEIGSNNNKSNKQNMGRRKTARSMGDSQNSADTQGWGHRKSGKLQRDSVTGCRIQAADEHLKAAFDRVNRRIMMEKLWKAGVRGRMYKLIEEIYKGTYTEVRTEEGITEKFETNMG
ncbi:hypothetical protein PV325_014027, partial [Microctonus aethiopoides]